MADEDAYKELEKRIVKLETKYTVAINTIKIGVGIFIALLTIFFGITYKQIGEVAVKAIESSTIESVIESAKSKADAKSNSAIGAMEGKIEEVRKQSLSAVEKINEDASKAKEISNKLDSRLMVS